MTSDTSHHHSVEARLLVTKDRRARWRQSLRTVRAMMRDTRALLHEFRGPILLFAAATLIGGFIYGELLVIAGYERLPYVDLPYFMLALMVVEAPTDVPHEWYLMIFWYIMPPIGIYIIGRGALDFVRLFFDRNERRNAWELAVASTYRNHTIVIGIGHVGLRVARTLTQMGFDTVVIDRDYDIETAELLKEMQIPAIIGDGRMDVTMDSAGIKYARSIVICTSNDHVNLEITMRVRYMNSDVRIITRMWDTRFAEQLKDFLNVEVMSASDLAAPAFAGAAVGVEITQTLNVSGEDFSMIQIQVAQGSFMDGKTIEFLQDDEDMDIVLHGENGASPVVHPAGSTVVHSGDTLVLFAKHSKVTEIVARNRPRRAAKA